MGNASVGRNRVVFINLTEMDHYDGLEANLSGGGRFVEQHGYGFEVFNFRVDNGKCYGYAPPYGKLNLSRISDEINRDPLGIYVDDVSVVFTCSRQTEGRIVCGFYKHARVYAEPISDDRSTRAIKIAGPKVFAPYNLVCNANDAVLVNRKDRKERLPHSTRNDGIGHGQWAVWYVDRPERKELKDQLLDYVQTLIDEANTCDEYKYHLHDERRTYVTTTQQISRSRAARAECIRLKGCYCNICGFDFERVYGKLGKGYIEVHHITPVGRLSAAEDYSGTDPKEDLIPVCSNCHSMIHRRKEPHKPEKIKAALGK